MSSLIFFLVGVVVIGATAFLAAGRRGGLPEAPDTRDVLGALPTGKLTAADLERIRFSVVFRGYRMSEVDEVLARLIEDGSEQAHANGPSPSPGLQ